MHAISFSSAGIKLIAIATMVADHVGLLFFPEELLWRVVGRVSMPLFAFLIAEGCEKTSDVRKYLARLIVFAFISQIPYSVFMFTSGFSPVRLNIFFTLASGLLALIFLKRLSPWYSYPFVVLLLFLVEYAPFDYGAYGILTILASSLFLRFRTAGITALFSLPILHTMAIFLSGSLSLQLYATVSVPFVMLYNGERGRALPREIFYWFYPAHLLFLTFVWYILNHVG